MSETESALPPMPRLVELLLDAARLGRDDMVPALLHAGVDIEVMDDRGHSPLILASYHGHDAATRALLDRGARPDGPAGFTGNSALMGVAFKGHAGLARTLIAAGADPDRTNGAGQTALMMAALVGRDEIVDLLIGAGADPARVDAAGNTAAGLARQQNNPALADRLEADTHVGGGVR